MTKLVKKNPANAEKMPEFMQIVLHIGAQADQLKAKDIKAYDVRGLTLVADAFVLCTATSGPQLRGIYNAVKDGLKEVGIKPLHSEGTFSGGWIVLDYGAVIFHIFREEARGFYDMDGLWGDAPQIELGIEQE